VPAFVLDERYEDLGPLGVGGMGEVRRVRDRHLGRVLAMKLVRADLSRQASIRARFETEARVTARLDHPGIVPVHDQGELSDGRLWYTMREVRTRRTLRDAIIALHWGGGPALPDVMGAFDAACQAVAYAHAQGVVHRDLKPDNIMLGNFGEVLVMDWGLARVVGAPDGSDDFDLAFAGGLTQAGRVLGTPPYMPPEQAAGEIHRHGPASDVYALGVVLYEILTGATPYDHLDAPRMVDAIVAGPPAPVYTRVPVGRGAAPDALIEACEWAMSREPESRPPHAGELGSAIRRWREGADRRDRALAVLRTAEALSPDAARQHAEATRLRTAAAERLVDVPAWAPVEAKADAWALEDEAAELERRAAVAERRYVETVRTALTVDPELVEAHAALASLYRERLEAAEARRDTREAAALEYQVRTHDRGAHAAWLAGGGLIELSTSPPGAEVELCRFVERRRQLEVVVEGPVGVTPLRELAVRRGSLLLKLRAPGRIEVVVPISLGRGEAWSAVRPGASSATPVHLPRADRWDPRDVYVPGGWFWSGGDPEAADGLPRRRLWVDGFVGRRFPVTVAEYLAFLDALDAAGLGARAEQLAPADLAGVSTAARPVAVRGPEGRWIPVPDGSGQVAQPDWPVNLVDWHGAAAYAAWESQRTGQAWRIPHDQEWEKLARGVDGRWFPWGDRNDPALARMAPSARGAPSRLAVDSYPSDAGPYGARGFAGNVRVWCANPYRRGGTEGPLVEIETAVDDALHVVRGGCWSSSPHLCRIGARFAARPADRLTSLGFRLVRSLGGTRLDTT